MEVTLRKWMLSDAPLVARCCGNPKMTANFRDGMPEPYTLQDAATFLSQCIKEDEALRMSRAILADGEAVGSVGVFVDTRNPVYRKTAEIAYYIEEAHWGQGIGAEAIRQACDLAFSVLDIARIEAQVYGFNQRSQRVLEKAGFQREGILRKNVIKKGKLEDSYLYALLRE